MYVKFIGQKSAQDKIRHLPEMVELYKLILHSLATIHYVLPRVHELLVLQMKLTGLSENETHSNSYSYIIPSVANSCITPMMDNKDCSIVIATVADHVVMLSMY